jgi:hypothetical protein
MLFGAKTKALFSTSGTDAVDGKNRGLKKGVASHTMSVCYEIGLIR